MSRVPLDIKLTPFAQLRAAVISAEKVSRFLGSVQVLLSENFMIHPGAVQRWRMGWLTERYPEEEIRLFIGSRVSPEDTARNIADRIRPYSDARERADLVQSLLVEKHRITEGGKIIDDWLILREDWSLVDELNRYVSNGAFNAEAAATAIAEGLKPISDAWHKEIEESFDRAEDKSEREMAEILAQREVEKLKVKFLVELRAKRNPNKR